jgi:hypothetical protein
VRRAVGCAESTALPCRCVWWWRRRRDYTQRQREEQIRAQTKGYRPPPSAPPLTVERVERCRGTLVPSAPLEAAAAAEEAAEVPPRPPDAAFLFFVRGFDDDD